MLGMIAAVTLLASVDPLVSPATLPDGGQHHVDDAVWSGSAAGMGLLGVLGGDFVAVLAAAAIGRSSSTQCHSSNGDVEVCINTTAALVAAVGLLTLPPTFALLLANDGKWETRAIVFAALAQGAAVASVVGAVSASSHAQMMGFFAVSAIAFHFVGIPLAVGWVPARAADAPADAMAPTLALALRW